MRITFRQLEASMKSSHLINHSILFMRRLSPAFICLLTFCSPVILYAQGFSLESATSYPFPSSLVAAPRGSGIALSVNEKGARNIYAGTGPDFVLKKITAYNSDEGQEITGIQFSPDAA